ncbi:MAG: ribonuclease Z [Candidatus Woesearchaeota archaeon]
MINLTLLGTSCMVPTKERNVSAFYLEYNGEGILIDCGEGTQRQMNIANINRNKVRKILISHWHADHISGILGLLHTMSNNQDLKSIEIFGPKGSKENFSNLMKCTSIGKISELNLKVTEVIPSKLTRFYENDDYYLEAVALDHNLPALAYSFVEKDRRRIAVSKVKKAGLPEGPLIGKLQQGKNIVFNGKKYDSDDLTYIVKGKKLSFVLDTSYTKNIIDIAKNADLLLCEATYLDKHLEKGEQYKHLTVKQAAQIAHSSNVLKLVMTHFSQRYKDMTELEKEAKDIFPESYIGFDFMKFKI